MWLTCALMASVLWGLNYVVSERLLKYLSPMTLLGIEMAIGAVIFLTCARGRIREEVTALYRAGQMGWMVPALVSVIVGNWLIATSIEGKDATLAALIEVSYPLWTVLFAWLLFGAWQAGWSVACGGLLIAAGVVVISLSGH